MSQVGLAAWYLGSTVHFFVDLKVKTEGMYSWIIHSPGAIYGRVHSWMHHLCMSVNICQSFTETMIEFICCLLASLISADRTVLNMLLNCKSMLPSTSVTHTLYVAIVSLPMSHVTCETSCPFSRRSVSIIASKRAGCPGSMDPDVWFTVTPVGRIEKMEARWAPWSPGIPTCGSLSHL